MLIPVMRNRYCLFGTLMASLVTILSGCQSNTQDKRVQRPEKSANASCALEVFSPNIDAVTKDFSIFWSYWNAHTNLALGYTALNAAGEKVDHGSFLKSLKEGKYLPVLIKNDGSTPFYKLVKIPKGAVNNISETVSYAASRYYTYSQMEGKPLPRFNFKDLDGHTYTNENCKGKVLVLNTWFIKCTACK